MASPLNDKFSNILRTLEQSVQSQKFTAWAVSDGSKLLCTYYADEALPYHFGLKEPAEPFLPLFDLASLTKALFTNTLFRMKLEPQQFFAPLEDLLEGSDEVSAELVSFFKTHKGKFRVADFLDHVAGSKNWFWFGRGLWAFQGEGMSRLGRAHVARSTSGELRRHVRKTLTSACLDSIRVGNTQCVYSDVDYFLLARILESLKGHIRVAEWELALAELNAHLGTRFLHASLNSQAVKFAVPSYPYLVVESFDSSHEKVAPHFGHTHDTNGNILSSLGDTENIVSGHVGLFGTVLDVVKASKALAESQKNILENIRSFRPDYGQGARFVLGLDTPTSESSLCGLKRWPILENTNIAGHLGYTGTSIWFSHSSSQPSELQVLLTNRTARRDIMKHKNVPRLCTYMDLESGKADYFTVEDGAFHKTLSADEMLAHNQFYFGVSQRFWNDRCIEAPNDIANVRREIGKALWSF